MCVCVWVGGGGGVTERTGSLTVPHFTAIALYVGRRQCH